MDYSAVAVSEAVASLPPYAAGSFALKVGDSLADLADVRAALDTAGLTVHMALDYRVSQGLYISDPYGNRIELYVDAPQQTWREEPSSVANSDPLTL